MRFLIDEQISTRLAQWLRSQGHAAEHVHEIGLTGQSDTVIIAAAASRSAVIVTKDADFQSVRAQSTPIVWIRYGNVGSSELIRRFASAIPECATALETGELFIEIR
jgi:predicted nuclease of predicted toxin-antitoxin system